MTEVETHTSAQAQILDEKALAARNAVPNVRGIPATVVNEDDDCDCQDCD